ncbi:MAG: TVP38/TMEM64 family protein [Syntrophales bacterium]|nr:TVP38/TMEM64 family protein [Syntrophales bacterium]
MNRKDILKLLVLILLIAAGIFFFVYFDLHSFFSDRTKIITFLQSFGPVSVFVFIGIQILQVLVAPIPGEVSGFIGGYIYGIYPGTLYSTIGLTIGSWLAFTLSRTLGLPFVERIVSPKIINQYDHIMTHQGPWVAFLLFLIPGFPKDALCYVLGLSHIRIMTFLVISTVGRLLGTLMLSVQGSFLRNNQDTTFLIVMAVSIIIAALGYFFGKRWYKKHHKPRPEIPTDRDNEPKQG